MTLPAAAAIDWTQPWLAPYRANGEAVAQAAVRGTSVADALQALKPAMAPDFVRQEALPPGQAYEAHVFQARAVPTRDNLHDLLNGLVWCAFPRTKQRLNELQAAEIAHRGVSAVRGPLRDALTLFDENGAVLDAPPALWRALIARDWHTLFVTQRRLWTQARVRVFGHALLEKLVAPRKAATAHVLLPAGGMADAAAEAFDAAIDDAALAQRMAPAWLAAKPFVPLPVLGIPGWCAGNAAPAFYADAQVFRPPKAAPETPAHRPG